MERKNYNFNTDLCVDIKTYLIEDRITELGKEYLGVLIRDQEDHYTFVENIPESTPKRNVRFYRGKHITVTRRDDGTPRMNFRPLNIGRGFTVEVYANEVANEIIAGLQSLVEMNLAE